MRLCKNEEGGKAFLLAQGYMPAQEFHVLKNPLHEDEPWYYEEEIQMKKVLIVVDMQNDFVSGSLGTPEAQSIVENIKNKISEYHKYGDRIIFTKDTHYDNYLETQEGRYLPVKHCICGTEGWEIAEGLKTEGCGLVQKSTFGYEDWKKEDLGAFDEIELVGVCTDICVITNALLLKTYCPEIKITVDAGCCAGSTPEKHRYALEVMQSCQIDIK